MHSTLTSRVLLHIRVQTSRIPPVFREATIDELETLDNLDITSHHGTELANIHHDQTAVPDSEATQTQTSSHPEPV